MARGKKATAVDAGPVEGPWDLPNGWCWERLGDLVIKSSAKHQPDKHSKLPFVGLEHIAPHEMHLDGIGAFSAMRSAGSAFERGDVLYGRLRPYLNKVWIADRAGACSGELLVLRPKPGMDARYIALNLHSQRYVYYASHIVTGDRPRIDFDLVAAFPVPVPDELTQRTIVARIDTLFAEIDAGEAALADARSGVEKYRKSLLKAAVTGELTAGWRYDNPQLESGADLLRRILAERRARWEADPKNARKKYVEPTGPDTDGLPELPEGWIWASLDQLCPHITSGSRAWSAYYDQGDATFIMAQNVRAGYYDDRHRQLVGPPSNDPERRRTKVVRDDLLLTIVGANTGDLCRVNFDPEEHYVCQSVALLRPDIPEVGSVVELFFATSFGRDLQMNKMIYGAGRPHLSFDQIRSLAVPLPNLPEVVELRRAAVEAISNAPSAEEVEAATMHVSTLRQSTIAAAFRGDLNL